MLHCTFVEPIEHDIALAEAADDGCQGTESFGKYILVFLLLQLAVLKALDLGRKGRQLQKQLP